MTITEFFQDAKEGDRQAFIEWSRSYQAAITRLGYQAGVPEQQLADYQLAVFQRFHERLPALAIEEAEQQLYLSAISILEDCQQQQPNEDNKALKFEEDIETHQALQQLKIEKRLPLALHYFQGKSLKEISEMLGDSEEKLALFIGSAKEFLTDKLQADNLEMTEKRLEFLDKSYRRIAVPFLEDRMFSEEPEIEKAEELRKPAQKPAVKKGVAAMLAVAGLFLAGVIGTSFIFNDSNSNITPAAEKGDGTTVTKSMVEQWEKEYEIIRDSSPGLLGLDEEVYEELRYVQEADRLKERTFSKSNIKKLKDNPKEMQYQVDKLNFHINTPKGMRESLSEMDPMITAEIEIFVHAYLEKTAELMILADGMLAKHQEELQSASVNGELSAEKLRAQSDDYPEELSRLINALYEHTLTLAVHPNEDKFRTIRDLNLFYRENPFSNDYFAMESLELLGGAPYFDETGFLVPVNELSYLTHRMEMFLLEIDRSNPIYEELAFNLQHIFFTMLKGDETNDVFDKNGVVKLEYQQIWTELAYTSSNPVIFLLMPIVEEMEKSGWTKSAHYDQLAYGDILMALDAEKNGTLAEQLPNGDVTIESDLRNMENYEYSESEKLYKEFTADYDLQILSEVKPLDVLMLYYYANKLEDPETMWHLLADDNNKPPKEEYLRIWKQLPDIKEEYTALEVYENGFMRMGNNLHLDVMVSHSSAIENMMMGQDSPKLMTAADHIWLVKYQINEKYTISEEETAYSDKVYSLYGKLAETADEEVIASATPGEIAGVFLLALEMQNDETVGLLLSTPQGDNSDQQIEYGLNASYLPAFSDLTKLTFNSETHGYAGLGLNGAVEMEYIQEDIVSANMMWMTKEDGSWRVNEMLSY